MSKTKIILDKASREWYVMYKKGRKWEKLYPRKFTYWNAEMVVLNNNTYYDRICKTVHCTTVDKEES